MPLLDSQLAKLQARPQRVVFPEGSDPRILQAARQFVTSGCGEPILLGDRADIKAKAQRLDIRMEGMRILEPERSEELDRFLPVIDKLPNFASLKLDEKESLILNRHNFAAMMLLSKMADALVGGASMTTSRGLRSLFHLIPTQPAVKSASSMLILDQEDTRFGEQGTLFLADCGVIPDPSAEQLADIAVSTSKIFANLTGAQPRVAFLSFATHARKPVHPSIFKIREAVLIAQAKAAATGIAADFEGEMQLDAALVPSVARQKGVTGGEVGGRANILVFPDLNSGNIAAKMLQVVAGARTYGQIIVGLKHACAEISRGAHMYDVFGTAVLTAAQEAHGCHWLESPEHAPDNTPAPDLKTD